MSTQGRSCPLPPRAIARSSTTLRSAQSRKLTSFSEATDAAAAAARAAANSALGSSVRYLTRGKRAGQGETRSRVLMRLLGFFRSVNHWLFRLL